MAEVLEITTKTLNNPIKGEHSTYYYNNYIYVITLNNIYRVDIINNTTTLLISKPSLGTTYYHTSMGVGKDGYIYYIDYTTDYDLGAYYGYIFSIMRYSIEDNSIEKVGENVVTGSTSGGSNFVSSPRNIFIYGDYINWVGYYRYSSGSRKFLGFYNYRYNIVSNTADNVRETDYRDENIYSYLNGLASTSLQQTNPNGKFFYGGTDTYPNRWIYANPIGTKYNTSADDLQFTNSATFWRGDEVYILSSESPIRIFNTTTGLLTILSQSLPIVKYPFCTEINDGYIMLTNEGYIKISFVEYNLTYYIKSSDGTHTYATHENSAPITKVLFGFDGETVSYILTTLTENLYGSYTPIKTEGKILSGYSFSPKSTKSTFNLNVELDAVIRNEATFYEVLSIYNPPSRTFQLNLYKNSAEPNRVDKTDYLEQIGTLYGAFRDETSITNMAITIQQADFPQFNYVYIPIFGRYYYVTDITSFRENLWEISLSIDVLMSYKDAIKSCYAFVDRNEFEFSDYVIDNKRVIEQGYDVEQATITNELFNKGLQGKSFILNGFALKSYTKE